MTLQQQHRTKPWISSWSNIPGLGSRQQQQRNGTLSYGLRPKRRRPSSQLVLLVGLGALLVFGLAAYLVRQALRSRNHSLHRLPPKPKKLHHIRKPHIPTQEIKHEIVRGMEKPHKDEAHHDKHPHGAAMGAEEHDHHRPPTKEEPKDDKKKKLGWYDPKNFPDDQPPYGELNHALYQVDAKLLGPRYARVFQYFENWIADALEDTSTLEHAQLMLQHPSVVKLRQTCYDLPDPDRFHTQLELNYDHQRPTDFSDNGAFVQHWLQTWYESQNLTSAGISTHLSESGKFRWSRPAMYSYVEGNYRQELKQQIRRVYLEEADASAPNHGNFTTSGGFWYPPHGAFREWHTNWDSAISQREKGFWRMYYVRQIADSSLQATSDEDFFNQSAMHIVDGPGLTPDRLREVGALPLTQHASPPNVWRVPDRNGYVGFFRLQMSEPFRWHTIVSDGNVHRFSLGLGSHSDHDVASILKDAGVPL